MASNMLGRRMKRELDLLAQGGASPGVSAWPRDDSRFDMIDAEITGAAGTPYDKGVFRLELNIPPEYPLKPPRVRFVTPIYHPNIDAQGRICLDTLTMPPKGAWKPSLNIATVLTTIQALMSSPNADDGLMAEITEEYRRNPVLFRQKAKSHTLKHACPLQETSVNPTSSVPPIDTGGLDRTQQNPEPQESSFAPSTTTDLQAPTPQHQAPVLSERQNQETEIQISEGPINNNRPPSALGRLKKRPRHK